MPVILKNNASSTLTTAVTTSDTGIVVANGSRFPTVAAGDYFYATLVSPAGTTEIVKVTARAGNSMTVVRAQDGSTAASFQVGTLVEMRVNAATVSVADMPYTQGGTGAVTRTVQSRLQDFVSVKDFGAVGDGAANDTAAIQAAVNSGAKFISFPRGTYLTNAELVVNASNITLDMQGCTIQTSANAPIIRFGAGATESTATSGGGITGTLSLVGSGAGNTNNHAIVVRNHSYASFSGTFAITNIGGSSIYTTAYARGNQYNSFMGAWTISGNYGYGIQIGADPAGGAGGYVNDNFFSGIRVFNPLAAANTQCYIDGGNENRFYGCGFETSRAADTLLHIVSGEGNSFYGLRLDGTNLSLALRLDSAAIANWFFGYSIDGTVTDASARNLFVGDIGSFSFPFIRFGSGDAAGAGWNIQMARPGSTDELHIGPQTVGQVVRFPSLGVYNFGDREGGDSSPVVFDPTNKRLNLNTLTSTAIGSGPSIRFDGRFSSSGNFAIQTVNQDQYGINCSFGGATYGLHSGTYISVADGVAAPAAVTGRARIYVDTADGDLKIVFGDGTIKTIVTDT